MMQFTEEQKKALIAFASNAVKQAEEARDEIPFGLSEEEEMEISLLAIALERLKATAPAVPEGWKLVPVEPTREMCDAFDKSSAWEDVEFWEGSFNLASGWEAMLSAAPFPSDTL